MNLNAPSISVGLLRFVQYISNKSLWLSAMRTCILMWICYYGFFFVLTRTIKSNCMKYKSSFREIAQIQSIWIWYTFVIKALKFHDHHFEKSNSLDLFFSQNGVSTWRNFGNFIWQILHIVGGTIFGVFQWTFVFVTE